MNNMTNEIYATVKPGWKMPEAPVCPMCGVLAIPVVEHTGDGWVCGWDCQSQTMCGPDDFTWSDGDGGIGPCHTWPFVEDYVWAHDWNGVGFELV